MKVIQQQAYINAKTFVEPMRKIRVNLDTIENLNKIGSVYLDGNLVWAQIKYYSELIFYNLLL